MRLLFALVCLGISFLCLQPGQIDLSRHSGVLLWDIPRRPADWVDIIANVLLFVPFGWTGLLAWPRYPLRTATLIWMAGTVFSFSLEWIQRLIPGRFASWRDVLCNSAGVAVGVALGCIALRWPGWRHGVPGKPLRGVSFAVLLTLAWLLSHGFPFLPVLRWAQLGRSWHSLLHPELRWNSVIDIVFETAVLYVVYRRMFQGWRRSESLAALAVLCACGIFVLQTVLIDFSFTPARLAASLLGLTITRFAFPSLSRRRYLVFGFALGMWLLIRQLWPFRFAQQMASFTWEPFALAFATDQPHLYARSMFGKWLLYTGTVWLLRQAGVRLATAVAVLSLLLASSEWAQCWIAGRTPESTDLVLLWIGAIVVARESKIQPTGVNDR